MFTGIVEEVGIVQGIKKAAQSSALTIGGKVIFADLKLGDSVAVNGVCLTVTGFNGNSFTADVMHETLKRSSLGNLKTGGRVNLERAMPANGRFGGHIVSGHIDGIGVISKIKKDDNAIWYTIKADGKLMRYIVEKGSVALDGVSLTVAEVIDESFSVSLIPHTQRATTFFEKTVGGVVNIENDMVGKYIEKLMQCGHKSGITREYLAKYGY